MLILFIIKTIKKVIRPIMEQIDKLCLLFAFALFKHKHPIQQVALGIVLYVTKW